MVLVPLLVSRTYGKWTFYVGDDYTVLHDPDRKFFEIESQRTGVVVSYEKGADGSEVIKITGAYAYNPIKIVRKGQQGDVSVFVEMDQEMVTRHYDDITLLFEGLMNDFIRPKMSAEELQKKGHQFKMKGVLQEIPVLPDVGTEYTKAKKRFGTGRKSGSKRRKTKKKRCKMNA